MNDRSYILQLLTSPSGRLLITNDEYISALLQYFPSIQSNTACMDDPKTYKQQVTEELISTQSQIQVPITTDYSSTDITPCSIGYHRVKGLITASSRYYFSSKQFELDLLAAESNQNIACHFVHVTSGGGEAWYLDRLGETMHSLAKPIYVLIERVCASAGYYIACNGTVVKAMTQNDMIGCIGTMIGFWDIEPYFETLGFKKIEEYAKRSDLKNKKYRNLKKGKPEQFITEELDPLQMQFEQEVRNARQALSNAPEEHPALRGETFDSLKAIENGLIDGITTFAEALNEAHAIAISYTEQQNQRKQALLLI